MATPVIAAEVKRRIATHFGAEQRPIAVTGAARPFEAALRARVLGMVPKQEALDRAQAGGLSRP